MLISLLCHAVATRNQHVPPYKGSFLGRGKKKTSSGSPLEASVWLSRWEEKSQTLWSVCAQRLETFSHLIFEVEGKSWFAERHLSAHRFMEVRSFFLVFFIGKSTFAEVVLAVLFRFFFPCGKKKCARV